MNYWLFKSEPDAFSIDDLKAMKGRRDHWDGIRNYQARNLMRDEMKKGDLGFFYHSSCCLLYTSPSPRDRTRSRMPSSA